MIVHILKMCTSYFIYISWMFFLYFFLGGGGGLELRHFSLEMLRWFLVCVICNSKSFHSLIFKLCTMIVHTLIMGLSFMCKYNKHFLIFRAVELRQNFFQPKCLEGVFLCNLQLKQFLFLYIQTCIMIVHTLNVYTLYYAHLIILFRVFKLDIVKSPTVDYIV